MTPATASRRRRRVIQSAHAGIPLDATPGEQIYLARRMARLTQIELAAAIGVNGKTVSHWECNGGDMTATHYLAALATCGYRVALEVDEE